MNSKKLVKGGHTSHLPLHTSNRGITLIALVITIIVLLILAGVTINMVLGDDGIIQNAQTAKNLNKDGQIEEALDLLRAEVKMAEYGQGDVSWITTDNPENPEETEEDRVIKWLVEKQEVVEEGELVRKSLQKIKYADESKTKTFSLKGIVEWDNSQADDFIYDEEDETKIVDYIGDGGDVIIPYGVTEIRNFWLSFYKNN